MWKIQNGLFILSWWRISSIVTYSRKWPIVIQKRDKLNHDHTTYFTSARNKNFVHQIFLFTNSWTHCCFCYKSCTFFLAFLSAQMRATVRCLELLHEKDEPYNRYIKNQLGELWEEWGMGDRGYSGKWPLTAVIIQVREEPTQTRKNISNSLHCEYKIPCCVKRMK